MVNIVLLFLGILFVRETVAPPSSSQRVCSAFCAPSGCSGFLATQCDNKCNNGAWGWTASGGIEKSKKDPFFLIKPNKFD